MKPICASLTSNCCYMKVEMIFLNVTILLKVTEWSEGVVVVCCCQEERFKAAVLFALFHVVVWLLITPESSSVLLSLGSWCAGFCYSLYLSPSLPVFRAVCRVPHSLTDKSSQIKDCQPCSLQMERKKEKEKTGAECMPGGLCGEQGCV